MNHSDPFASSFISIVDPFKLGMHLAWHIAKVLWSGPAGCASHEAEN